MDTYDPTTRPLTPRLASDERGFTLVEMMVAILLLAIVLSAMVTVILTSLTSMQREEQRVRATQLAQEELERLRAIEWDCAAIDSSDPDYSATYNGNTTVVLDAAECSDTSIAPDPTPTVRAVDGVDYTITRNVYWIDDPADGTAGAGTDAEPQDYKEFEVDVAWTFRGEAFTYVNTSTRAPTVEEVPLATSATPATMAITSLTVDPSSVGTSGGATTQTITVTVETSQPATIVQLVVAATATYGTATLADVSSGNGTRWQVTIPSGSTAFPNGDHDFTITATGSAGTDTATQAVTFANAPAVTPVTVNAPALAPAAPICVANNKKTHFPVVVTVDVDGVSVTDEVALAWTDKTGSATVAPVATTANGAQFTATIPAGETFNSTTTTLVVDARRISDNTVAQGTFSVAVFRTNNSADCP